MDWSPDGKWIAFLAGEEDKKFAEYGMERAALVPSDGSAAPALVKAIAELDRGVSAPRFTSDGTSLTFLVADDRSDLSRERGTERRRGEAADEHAGDGEQPDRGEGLLGISQRRRRSLPPRCIYRTGRRCASSRIRTTPSMNELQVAQTEEVSFKSKDGTEVHGLLTRPVGYAAGTKVPFLLRIHGGPNGQDAHSFSTERQFFAGQWIRGDGRELSRQRRPRAEILARHRRRLGPLRSGRSARPASSTPSAAGVADPDRLGVGGWSYGAILTDYMIATDTRFKAATSGAGTGVPVAFYGTDQYIIAIRR